MLQKNLFKKLIKPRTKNSNKYTFGHALLIVGSSNKMGAAAIASKACLRSGVGLLTVLIPKKEKLVLQVAIPEAMLEFREDSILNVEKYAAIGIGCGIGITASSKKIISQLLSHAKIPLVLDADALHLISLRKKLLKSLPPNTILTPHAGEFDRLFGIHQTQEERTETAKQMAKQYDIIIVLKGDETKVACKEKIYINKTGNAGLAKAGSGDALTGIIVSLLAQGYTPFDAATLGVYIHGLAADHCLATQSMESMLITDVINCLGSAFKAIHSNK